MVKCFGPEQCLLLLSQRGCVVIASVSVWCVREEVPGLATARELTPVRDEALLHFLEPQLQLRCCVVLGRSALQGLSWFASSFIALAAYVDRFV